MEQEILNMLPVGKLKVSRPVLSEGESATTLPHKTHSCLITFLDPETDPWVRKAYGVAGLRRHKLLRLTGEAYEQKLNLNQEMVSFDILGCGLRTLQRDIAFFSSLGVLVPFQRSFRQPRQERFYYKVAAAKLFLDGMSKPEITARLYLHPGQTDQFIRNFAKLAKLADSGLSMIQIETVSKQPEVLIKECLELFKTYNTPNLFKALDLLTKAVH